jgi:hypothetical protein
MNKHPQDRFHRLVVVSPTDSKRRQQPAGKRWWGPRRPSAFNPNHAAPTIQTPSHALRMAVMPTLSRNLLFAVIVWVWNALRSHFGSRNERLRGADVLMFRRPAAPAAGFRRAVTEQDLVNKKANGSVGWHGDCEAEPLEGGRR